MNTDLYNQASDALLKQIIALAPHVSGTSSATVIRDLAEALAWVERPDNPHGGSS